MTACLDSSAAASHPGSLLLQACRAQSHPHSWAKAWPRPGRWLVSPEARCQAAGCGLGYDRGAGSAGQLGRPESWPRVRRGLSAAKICGGVSLSRFASAPGASCPDQTPAQPLCGLPQDWLFASQAGPSAEPQPPLLVALALWEREAVSGTPVSPRTPPTHWVLHSKPAQWPRSGYAVWPGGRAGLGSIRGPQGGPQGSSVDEPTRLTAWGWGFSTLPCAGSWRGAPGACHPGGGGRRRSVGSNDLQREQNHSLSWGRSGLTPARPTGPTGQRWEEFPGPLGTGGHRKTSLR